MRTETECDQLLRLLADGKFHSGQVLAHSLGIGRSAVWKRIRRLQDVFDIRIDAVRGRGYRLRSALELLSVDLIDAYFSSATREKIETVTCVMSTGSTNSLASDDPPCRSNLARVWFSEHQSAARGRRGRQWVCSFADNIYLSLAWRFERPMSELGALSLVAGVAVCEALAECGIKGHGLKWPNDIVHSGRKLAGILVEVSGEASGPATAIIGLGVNVSVPDDVAASIDQPWVDLAALGAAQVSRNHLAGLLTDLLVSACAEFARDGLPAFVPRWQRFDVLVGQCIRVQSANRVVEGHYAGISPHGALLLDGETGRSEHLAGEVSVRGVIGE